MEKEGKYVYCIVETKQERNFGSIGIGNNEVLAIGYEDLSMVVSNRPMTRIVVSRENMVAHEKVIEEVMKEFDSVLPVRFGTIASDADEIRNLLDRRYREFMNLLRDMDHKIELGVKGLWTEMNAIFMEIANESKEIKRLKRTIQEKGSAKDSQLKMEIGRLVHEGLQEKKAKEADKVVDALRRTAIDHKLNSTSGDEMFMNAAFLVDKGREKEFDNIMDDLSEELEKRAKFMYAGPLPVFNFVNVVIYPEEWER